MQRSPNITLAVLVIGVFLGWLPFCVFAPLGFVLWLPFGIWTLARGGWRAFVLSIALTPPVAAPVFSVAAGGHDYFSGTAVLRGSGHPGPESGNLDRELRIYSESSGCVVTGTEPLTQLPYNLVVTGLIHTLGPMRGAWTGAYPTREEVWMLLSAGTTLHEGISIEVIENPYAPSPSLRLRVAETGEEIAWYTYH